MEIVVIVSGHDSTVNICKKFTSNLPHLKIHQVKGKISAGKARNIGISISKGEICFFIDSDCSASGNWIQKILKNFEDFPDVVGIIGVYSGGISLLERIMGGELASPEKRIGVYSSFIEGNCAFKRILFEKGCGFGEGTYGEAYILGECIKKHNFQLLLDPNLSIVHHGYYTLSKYVNMGRNYNSWYLKYNTNDFLKASLKAVLRSSFVFLSIFLLFFLPFLWNLRFDPFLKYFLSILLIIPLALVNLIFTVYIHRDFRISTRSKIKYFPYLLFLRWMHQFGYLLGALESFFFAVKQ